MLLRKLDELFTEVSLKSNFSHLPYDVLYLVSQLNRILCRMKGWAIRDKPLPALLYMSCVLQSKTKAFISRTNE